MTIITGWILKIGLCVVGAAGVFVGTRYLHMPANNIIEEVVEAEIKQEVGLDINLTPGTPQYNTKQAEAQKILDAIDNATALVSK